jgi:diguanylate cyclase (GGDEF)-like protein/PAS domain S-box-containing protein
VGCAAEEKHSFEAPRISNLLLRSHLMVATVGGGALMITFLAILLLRTQIENLAENQVPLERTAVQLMSGTKASLAALRGWVSLEQQRFIEQWNASWQSSIHPAFEQLKHLEPVLANEQNRAAVQRLKYLLYDLEESQWWVHSVAQVAGNQPAAVVYREQTLPVAETIMLILDDLQYHVHAPGTDYSLEMMTISLSIRKDFFALWLEVELLVNHGHFSMLHSYLESINNLQRMVQDAKSSYSEPIPDSLRLLGNELDAFRILADETISLRLSPEWNRAQHLMETETIPIAEEVLAIVNNLLERATKRMNMQVTTAKRYITLYAWIVVFLLILVILAALAIARRHAHWLALPVTRLAQAVEAFAQGKLEGEVKPSGSYEMASLGNSFNAMRKQLDDSRKALYEANDQLEERVYLRTKELQEAKDRLQQSEERLRLSASVFEHSVEGVVITDPQGTIVDVNRAFSNIMGYTRDEVLGKNPRFWSSGRHSKTFFSDLWRLLTETGQWRGELWNRRKDGSVFPEWLTINDVHDARGELTHYIGIFTDISHIKKSQEQLDFLAHHDPLTKLPNRLLMLERLSHAIARAERQGILLAVLFVDLDRFKQINDSMGHPQGDLLLQHVSSRLGKEIRNDDTLARIGGDEFVLLLEGINKVDTFTHAAQKLIALFDEPFILDQQEVNISASIGIAIYPEDGQESTTLLRNADAAMYRAKEIGRDNYQFYTQELTKNALARVAMESRLRHALDRGELYLVYQPQVALSNGAIIGAESLLRWQSPDLGLVSPATFIPFAEESGLIHSIGQWVLSKACRQGRLWLDQGYSLEHIAVNISGMQIQRGNLVDEVTKALEESRLPPERLELEVTEGFIMEDPEFAIKQLSVLRDLGVMLSIDDFGTGYSSLSYLKRLPIDKLKIDQSFVRDIPKDQDDMAITNAVIAMGHTLGLAVIAEGIETDVQVKFLTSRGCKEGQGYLFSKPLPADEFKKLLCKQSQIDDEQSLTAIVHVNKKKLDNY